MKITKLKTKDFYITARMSVSYPAHWTEDDVEEVFRSRLNTHLNLNDDKLPVNNELVLDDVCIRQIADESPYREP